LQPCSFNKPPFSHLLVSPPQQRKYHAMSFQINLIEAQALQNSPREVMIGKVTFGNKSIVQVQTWAKLPVQAVPIAHHCQEALPEPPVS
jgi:hypothetical protein